ncbi:Ras family protein [Cryptosporidium muris RN66]|uniref:Ras family protein n=1 Tax=Cryptosporidium muris (strain RN66) TaxID=441375 RepID=B6A9P6_CRYMR|nr:Ras family protein [Cryptosporidium muris RN66]EEA04937.1 Ras family protein [Cryptosporidium muris RN66]|eukprot:XP_002139286.1 Ras family protein [Cryptosporidium muris RN66]
MSKLKPQYQTFPLIRITLIGPYNSGKSTIADTFVNNQYTGGSCSSPLPQLYYRTIRLPPDGSEIGDPTSICVEIEDLPGINVSYLDEKFISHYFNMNRRDLSIPAKYKDILPFSIWDPPKVPMFAGQKYQALSQGRMGFILVFDINDSESLHSIEFLYQKFQNLIESTESFIKPVVFLCANKFDLNIEKSVVEKNIVQIENFASKMFVRLWKVSALTNKNINHMFRDMLYLIYANASLWQIDLRYLVSPYIIVIV